MDLEDEVKRFLDDDDQPEDTKEGIRALWLSHLTTGMQLEKRGQFHEALAEYAKEHYRPIRSSSDAEIVQTSYWHAGLVHRKLGEPEKAVLALEKSRELLTTHKVGILPHDDLAEVLIELGRLDEAIAVCQDSLSRVDSWPARQILATALRLKEDLSSTDGGPQGS